MLFTSFWNTLIILGLPVIVLVVLGFGLVFVIRKGVKGSGISNKVMHAELVRIDERLTAIEKMLKDID
jgi:ABC-type sugar transport system permease subunit